MRQYRLDKNNIKSFLCKEANMVGMAKKKNVIKKMGGGMAKKKNVIKKMGGGMAKKKNVIKKMGGGMANKKKK